jgi:hypothetical protein
MHGGGRPAVSETRSPGFRAILRKGEQALVTMSARRRVRRRQTGVNRAAGSARADGHGFRHASPRIGNGDGGVGLGVGRGQRGGSGCAGQGLEAALGGDDRRENGRSVRRTGCRVSRRTAGRRATRRGTGRTATRRTARRGTGRTARRRVLRGTGRTARRRVLRKARRVGRPGPGCPGSGGPGSGCSGPGRRVAAVRGRCGARTGGAARDTSGPGAGGGAGERG